MLLYLRLDVPDQAIILILENMTAVHLEVIGIIQKQK